MITDAAITRYHHTAARACADNRAILAYIGGGHRYERGKGVLGIPWCESCKAEGLIAFKWNKRKAQ